MFPLDGRTLDRVARLVVDIDSPNERRGYELEQLLSSAGWADPPQYDGSQRIPWLVDALTDRSDSRADIERFLCRVCDPLEYDGGMAAADACRQELNRVLEFERLVITYVGGRPVLGELTDESERPVYGAPVEVERRLRVLLSDEQVIALLVDRIEQSRSAEASGAYLLALFGIGSFVEGLLFTVLKEQFPDLVRAGFRGRDGRQVPASRAGLELLIETAHRQRLIELDARNFLHHVRDFRNYIHPRQQLERDFTPNKDTVNMCWMPVNAVLNDLEERVTERGVESTV
ncbi:hypothetical protein [Kutzneria sp. NPDC052558]|uniref:hypothetical protein n=1 Tax=Kutzneria sp. NPDC052558 TaxID=3364121 RepID=UPI0037C6F7DD